MREIKGLADTVKATVAQLRANAAQATNNFQNEVNHTNANIGKLNSLTAEMANANKDVEAILADAGSNFAPLEQKADSNGVTVNKAK